MSLGGSTYFQTMGGDSVAVGDVSGALGVFLMSAGHVLTLSTTLSPLDANTKANTLS